MVVARERPMCEKHNIPLNKRQKIREGESRYFCVKCSSEEKRCEVKKDAIVSSKE